MPANKVTECGDDGPPRCRTCAPNGGSSSYTGAACRLRRSSVVRHQDGDSDSEWLLELCKVERRADDADDKAADEFLDYLLEHHRPSGPRDSGPSVPVVPLRQPAPGPLLPQLLGPSCLYHNQLLGVSYHGRGTSSSDSPQLPGPSCQLQCLLGTWSLGRCHKHRTATTILHSPIVVVSWLLGSPRSGQSCSRWASLRTPAIGSGTQSSGTRPSGRGTSWMWSGLDQRTRAGSWRLT